jgi:3-hydroxyacyl-[acyl-carrier-protein] dehydratase
MLYNSFYTATLISDDESIAHYTYNIKFSKHHPIFSGHFPNQPVVPGVTLIQMIKELVVSLYGFNFTLHDIVATKFLQVINPLEDKSYLFNFSIRQEDTIYIIDASLKAEDSFAFKCKAKFKRGK